MLKPKKIFSLFAFAVIVSLTAACNAKSEEDEDVEPAITYSNVAVSKFSLLPNKSIINNLDSVFFSIDLEKGLIFNADSLPKGTKVSRLVPEITFVGGMTKAELIFTKDNRTDTTVNFLANKTDSIDFTHPVKLEVTAADGTSSFSYTIKVNVHLTDPDTLIWDKLESAALPSRYSDPVAQKTLHFNGKYLCLIEEYNAQLTLSETADLNTGNWTKNEIEFGFVPIVDSFIATEKEMFLLDVEGSLYSSGDGTDWTATGEIWTSIIGDYNGILLGLKENNGYLIHTAYPSQTEEVFNMPMSPSFPVSGISALGIIETKWSPTPIAIFAGGVTETGDLSSSIWGFDGVTWETINSTPLPALDSPMLARYMVYKDTPLPFREMAFEAWILFGGKTAEGILNDEMFVSLDNGVNWSKASEYLKLPGEIPSLYGADILVVDYSMSTDLDDLWTRSRSRTRAGLNYTIEGYDILWQCPYLYIFGGYDESGILSSTIWRGLLARLSFTPLI